MRLQLIAAAAIACAATTARAQPAADRPRSVSAALQVYADDDHVTVVSPSASAHDDVSDRLALDVETAIDVVSAASIDVVTQASPYAFSELRVEGGLTARWSPAPAELRASLAGSTEHDYDALRLGVGVRRDLREHTTTLDLGYQLSLDQVGRVGDPSFDRGRDVHAVELTATQVLDRRTVVDLVLAGSVDHGYLASPYRFVPIVDPGGARMYSLAEAVPERRLSAAVIARGRRALGGGWFARASYRFAADSWRIRSHTVELHATRASADDRLALSVSARGYLQGAASFWSRTWIDDGGGAPAWRSLDRTLGGMSTLAAGITADRALGGALADDAVHVFASITLVRFGWRDFAPQAERTAVIAALGASTPF